MFIAFEVLKLISSYLFSSNAHVHTQCEHVFDLCGGLRSYSTRGNDLEPALVVDVVENAGHDFGILGRDVKCNRQGDCLFLGADGGHKRCESGADC